MRYYDSGSLGRVCACGTSAFLGLAPRLRTTVISCPRAKTLFRRRQEQANNLRERRWPLDKSFPDLVFLLSQFSPFDVPLAADWSR